MTLQNARCNDKIRGINHLILDNPVKIERPWAQNERKEIIMKAELHIKTASNVGR